ncbi:MAG: PAS domain S-box protein [bacterium]|nr:PAS domain S-box protein [bacterium]
MVDDKDIYKLISETIHEGLLELDLHGKIVQANPAALVMLGFTLAELIQKTHRDLTPTKWHQQESQNIQEATLSQGKPIRIEQEYLRKNGSVFPVALEPLLITDDDKKPVKILILFQDLTIQKEQEQSQQTRQRQLNSLSLIIKKLQENSSIEQTIHFILEALVAAMTHSHLAVPLIALEDETFSTNRYSDDLEYGLTSSLYINGREAGEVTVYYSENAPFVLPDEQNILDAVANTLGIWLSLKSAGQELADYEEQYRTIFDAMADGFALYEMRNDGQELIVRDWNRAAEKMYNLLRPDVLGQDIRKFFPAMEKNGLYKTIVECAQAGEAKTLPLVHYQDEQRDQYVHNIIYPVGDKVAAIFRDVTAAEKVRQDLMNSEQKYRSLIEGSAEAIYLHSLDPANPRFVDINERACQMLHYTRAELLALGPAKIDSPENAALVPERVAKVLKDGRALFESEHITKEGQHIPVEINTSVVEISGQKYILSFARDITERKQAVAALKENQRFLNNIVENIPDMIFVKEAETLRFKLFNKAGETLIGHSRGNLYGKNDYDFFPQDEADHFVKKDREVLNGKKELDIPEEKILTKDKGERVLHTKKIPILDEKGAPVYLLGISEDITERKRTEELLRKKDEELSTILDSSPAMIFYKDKDNKFVRVNQAMAKSMGLTKEQLEGQSLFGLYPKEEAEKYWQDDRAVMDSGQPKLNIVEHMQTQAGKKWVQTDKIPYKNEKGEIIGIVGFAVDITERKIAAEEIVKAAQEWASTFDAMSDGVSIQSLDYTILNVNRMMCQMLGKTREEIVGRKCYEIFHNQDSPLSGCPVEKFASSRKEEHVELFEPTLNRWISVTVSPIMDETGKVAKIVHLVRDITERKQTEELIRQSEIQYRTLVNNLPGAVYRCVNDPDWTMYFISDTIEALSGYPAADFIDNKERTYNSIIYPDDRDMVYDLIQQKIKTRDPYALDYRLLHRDGTIRWVTEKGQGIYDDKGALLWLDGAIFDITERKKQEQRYKAVIETSIDGFWMTDLQGNIIEVNDSYCKMIGYSQAELLKMKIFDLEVTEKPAEVQAHISKIMETGNDRFETKHKRQDGSIIDVWISVTYLRETDCMFVFASDITERKRAEEALRVSENRYRLLAENATDVIWTVDLEMNPTYISPSITRLVGYTVDEAMKRSMAETFTPRSYELAQKVFAEELAREKAGMKDISRSRALEIELNHKNGSIVIAEIVFNFLRDADNRPQGILAMARDVTERTRMNAELQKRMNELDRFNKVTMEREKRIIELKKKVKDLEQKAHG